MWSVPIIACQTSEKYVLARFMMFRLPYEIRLHAYNLATVIQSVNVFGFAKFSKQTNYYSIILK